LQPAQLGDQKLQLLDLNRVGDELRLLLKHQALELFDVIG